MDQPEWDNLHFLEIDDPESVEDQEQMCSMLLSQFANAQEIKNRAPSEMIFGASWPDGALFLGGCGNFKSQLLLHIEALCLLAKKHPGVKRALLACLLSWE